VDILIRHRNSCCCLLKRSSGHDAVWSAKRSGSRKIALLIESQEVSMGKLTAEQKVREYNRGQNAAKKGHSRYWSEPSAYPFESDEHYQGRTEAFDQGYDDQHWHELKKRSCS
jgi:hypothetical protein